MQLLAQAGLEFFNNVILELKWKPKTDATSSDEEPAKPEKPSDDEICQLSTQLLD